MNKTLKELLPNPTAVDYSISYDGHGFDWYDEQKMIEYGLRIVEECMKVAKPNYMGTPEDSVYYVERAIDRIAEHFGIEE